MTMWQVATHGTVEAMVDLERDATLEGDGAGRRMSSAVAIARRGAATLGHRAPGAARVTRAGARGTTTALQQLPDSTLRWLAAGSIGLATGLQVAGAPRLVRVAGVAPALFMGAAIALRPPQRAAPATQDGTVRCRLVALDRPGGESMNTGPDASPAAASVHHGSVTEQQRLDDRLARQLTRLMRDAAHVREHRERARASEDERTTRREAAAMLELIRAHDLPRANAPKHGGPGTRRPETAELIR